MRSRLLNLLLDLALIFVVLGIALGLGFWTYGLFAGQAVQTSLPMLVDHPAVTNLLARGGTASVGTLSFDKATLAVRGGGSAYKLLQGLDIVITGALWVMILVGVRKVVRAIGARRHFETPVVARLRLVGWAMILLDGWQWLRMLAFPPLLLSTIEAADPGLRLLPAISRPIEGMRNARVEASLDLMLLVTGLIVLALAEAFRTGLVLREENEAIV